MCLRTYIRNINRPPVLSRLRQGGKVHMLRVQDQAKQAAHSGPLLSRVQVPQAGPPRIGLHNLLGMEQGK
jgi:hypothetical protein